LVLGIVEGATEYLPVSSTGHLCVVERLMGIGDQQHERRAADAYAICIQLGAILAVLWLYRTRIGQMLAGLAGRDPAGRRLLMHLLLAFVPAAVLGVSLGRPIKAYLFAPLPIAVAWIVGGLAILVLTRWKAGSDPDRGTELTGLTAGQALAIGMAQALAMWPGISRSLVTIVGGLLLGLRLTAAVEFSFLLGLVTLSAATVWEMLQEGETLLAAYGAGVMAVGLLAAFASALLAVRWMVAFLTWRQLSLFGYYRIAIGLITVALVAGGVL
jgi:undecaprenyl-diphosphatase